jgi:branched-chain amino acid transport system ATP-binding protein
MLLKIKDIEINYGDIKVIYKISLDVKKNEVVAIIGQNGAGKTTLLSAIAGLLPFRGDILYKDETIKNRKISDIVKKGIILVPEGAGVFPNMSVFDNLLMGAFHIKSDNIKKQNLAEVFSLFPRLKERINQHAGTLSGGERQMLAIGRALMAEPELILLDEPSLGLQPSFVDKIFEIIEKLRNLGKTVLLVEQNVKKSLDICNRAYVMEHGKIVMHGKADDLKNNKYVKNAYLGI